MIKLDTKQKIILASYIQGKSIRTISRELELHRKTVTKYIKKYEGERKILDTIGTEESRRLLIEDIIEPPKYNTKNRTPRKLNDEIIEKVKNHLKENEKKTKSGRSKQRKKAIDIHKCLADEGYDISYATINNLVRRLKNKSKEAFIKQEYDYGDVCEFDWGEVKLNIGDKGYEKYYLAAFATAKGWYLSGRVFQKQNTQAFEESHAEYFEEVGGVYSTMTYDNMRVAVKKFIGRNEKEPTEALLKLSTYYGFNFRFCNVRKGNEKGHVERSVEVIRRAAFAYKDTFATLDEANEYLKEACSVLNDKPKATNEGLTAMEVLQEEKRYLKPLMPKYECAEKKEVHVDKYATIVVNTCHYSVPERHVGKVLTVKIYTDKMYVYSGEELISESARNYGQGKWEMKLEHYLETLTRKPGAVKGSTVLKQSNELIQKLFTHYFEGKVREFIELIKYMRDKERTIEEIYESIGKLEKINPTDISKDKIILLCEKGDEHIRNNNIDETTENARELLKKASGIMNNGDAA